MFYGLNLTLHWSPITLACLIAAVLGDDVIGELAVEEGANGVYALGARDFGDIGRRLDAKMAQSALPEVPQHDAVITAEFDDERIGPAGQNALHHSIGEHLEVKLHVT